ncbi:MAG: tetratricopeptide repeat protein [Cytophagaceae bacterium]|nr:tetratricopeptide repeat protein [Cytophagaceae bacterium]MDW8457386.1 tetratricopeptide repeat protein [Cytophagaceae bacterium]
MKKKFCLMFFLIVNLFAHTYSQTLKEVTQYMLREQYSKAKSSLLAMMKSDPKNFNLHYYMGSIYLENDMTDSARYWFMEGIKGNPEAALNYVGMAKITLATNPTESKANADKALSLAKKDAAVYMALAEYYLSGDKKDPARALEMANKTIEINKREMMHYIMIGDAYNENNDGSNAVKNYKLAITMDPKSPVPHWKIGRLYLSVKNYESGEQSFKDGLALDNTFSPIHRDLGEIYFRKGKNADAIACYKKYIELRDRSNDVELRYASFLFYNKDYTSALATLNALEKRNYDNIALYRIMGYCYYETGDMIKANEYMQKFFSKADEKKIITNDYVYMGKIYSKDKKDSLAIIYYSKALERDPSKVELYGELGMLYLTNKQFDKAAEMFTAKINKTQPTANDYFQLGRSYYLNEKYTQADSAFSKVIEMRPEITMGYLWKGRSLASIDTTLKQGLAKPVYEKLIEVGKADPEKNKKDLIEAYSYLGYYHYAITKDRAKSDEAWQNILKLDPNNKKAQEALQLNKTLR